MKESVEELKWELKRVNKDNDRLQKDHDRLSKERDILLEKFFNETCRGGQPRTSQRSEETQASMARTIERLARLMVDLYAGDES